MKYSMPVPSEQVATFERVARARFKALECWRKILASPTASPAIKSEARQALDMLNRGYQ